MNRKLVALACCAALAASISTTAAAQAIYKCGSSYSQSPCEGGTTLHTDASRRETARAPDDMAKRQARLADAMEKARLQEEAKPASVYIPAPKPVSTEETKKIQMTQPGKVKYFTAIAPGEPGDSKKKKKGKKKA